jgi:hypothetical protein
VPADAEEILDDAVDRREALKVRDRFETAHLALAVAGRLMRHFDASVRIRGCAVQDRRDQGTVGGLIARQLVGEALLQKSDSIPNALPPYRLGDGQKRLHLPI